MVSAAAFLCGIIVGRTCGIEQFGLYILGLSIITLLMEVHEAIIWSPYTVFSPHLSDSAFFLYTGSSFVHQLILSFLSTLLLGIVGVFLLWVTDLGSFSPIIWVLVFVSAFFVFQEYARRVCFATLRIKAALLLDTFAIFVQISAILALAYFGKLSASNALKVLGVGCGLAGLLWLVWFKHNLKFSCSAVVDDFYKNWSFGKWILGSAGTVFLGAKIFPWALAGFHGTGAVGLLGAGQGVTSLIYPFLRGSCIFLEPKSAHTYAHGGREALRSFVIKMSAVLAVVAGLFSLFAVLFGSKLVFLLYGFQHADLSLVITVLAVNVFVIAIDHAIYYSLLTIGKTALIFKINFLRLTFSLTFGLFAVIYFGILGAALGLLLGSLVTTTLYVLFFLKLFYAEN
jgi:O-antigen/teichoic acid export membrane protein